VYTVLLLTDIALLVAQPNFKSETGANSIANPRLKRRLFKSGGLSHFSWIQKIENQTKTAGCHVGEEGNHKMICQSRLKGKPQTETRFRFALNSNPKRKPKSPIEIQVPSLPPFSF
jgi:hypothetical protein